MKLSPNLSLFQILSPRDWWILPDLNWRQNWFQLISLNRAHQKVCTGDIFEYPNVGNSVWFSIWYLITRSWLWFFVSKAHKILSFVAHSTASSRWFLDAHNFIPTLDHFNLHYIGLILLLKILLRQRLLQVLSRLPFGDMAHIKLSYDFDHEKSPGLCFQISSVKSVQVNSTISHKLGQDAALLWLPLFASRSTASNCGYLMLTFSVYKI